ncbi:hypothetical protein MXD81_16810, partial [Microbacteriaceae bacterium K1510]|nr:hypothetical protein [Microbacteriaceae bacterium K1510]
CGSCTGIDEGGRRGRPYYARRQNSTDGDLTEQSGNGRDHQKAHKEPRDRAVVEAVESLRPFA